MKRVILIKYGELTTKKDNRNFFIKTLRNNIKERLSSFDYEIIDDYYRMFIIPNEDDIVKIVNVLKDVFGIHEIVIAYSDKNRDEKNIKDLSLKLMNECTGNTFKVDVHKPDITLNIEIRSDSVYIYKNGISGLRGYPVGTLGRALLMLSGGIDSPVAGYQTIKRGVELYYIYFESRPHTSIEARNKVISLARKLERYNSGGKLFVINFTKIQEAIYKNLDPSYLITIMRRRMYEIAVRVAKRNHCLSIVNGESIGQVASQTLSSMIAVNDVTNYPILRPLCSFDKLDIIEIAKKIDTYDISILPYEDCCTVFVPRHPVINPDLKHIYEEESKFDFTELVNEAIKNAEIVELKEVKSQLL